MKYLAYGSNMNAFHMQERCPGIIRIGKCLLDGFRLVFDYHADIIPDARCSVHGGLWQITKDHEGALDSYEGYPSYYDKHYEDDLMFYRMIDASTDREPPARWYLQMVVQGYCDFGLTQKDFEESLGVKHLGLTQSDLEESLDVSMDELKQMFSDVTPTRIDS